jgi:membrane protein involved in D-alanine export
VTPYASLTYFLVAFSATLPAAVAAVVGRSGRLWLLVLTTVMLLMQYSGVAPLYPGHQVDELWLVLGFGVLQFALASTFLVVRSRWSVRWPFYVVLLLALVPLIATRVTALTAPDQETFGLVGFLGISYVTFRALDVLIGIQDRLIRSVSAVDYLLFLFFFPTVSSGPIDRYRRFTGDLGRSRSRSELVADADAFVHQLFTGLLYKFVIATLIERYWLGPARDDASLLGTISFMYAYSLDLFFDFAGYSAFAIGLSYLLGVHTPENFRRPFLAPNIREFWDRWHISLSHFLRDLLYMRFVMLATRRRWLRGAQAASSAGLLLSFGLMGAWHGLQGQYLLYGLYHAALMIGHELFGRWERRRGTPRDGRARRLVSTVVTFHCVCFGFLIFSGRLTP